MAMVPGRAIAPLIRVTGRPATGTVVAVAVRLVIVAPCLQAGLTALVAPAGTAVIPVCVLKPVAAEIARPVQLAAPVESRRNGVGATDAVAALVGSFAVSDRVEAEVFATPIARVMGSAPRLGDGRCGGQAQSGDGDKGETDLTSLLMSKTTCSR